MHTSKPERLSYGIRQAVEATSVGRSMLYEEIKAGKLKSFTIGNRRLIAAADLEVWLNAYRNHAA